MSAAISNGVHRRRNLLTGDWVLVSPHRINRPWQGQVSTPAPEDNTAHDANCYLCAGNTRAEGVRNPNYEGPFVFANDFPALLPADAPAAPPVHGLFTQQAAAGVCEVVCFSPHHSRTLPKLNTEEITAVIDTWCARTQALGRDHAWVQVFENKGEQMGCSNPHPHGQIWATNYLPSEIEVEDAFQRDWYMQNQVPLLHALAEAEQALRTRVVIETPDWLVIVPYWASWPFETLVLPRFSVQRLPDLTQAQRISLADVLKRLTARYDNLFGCSFPYSMGWHGAPSTAGDHSHWQLHAHFFPPLLRSASVRKFMVGYEMLCEAQRDLTPESAAERLRALSDIRFGT